MSDNEPPGAASSNRFPVIRQVETRAVVGWLRAGWRDLRQGGSASLFPPASSTGCVLPWPDG